MWILDQEKVPLVNAAPGSLTRHPEGTPPKGELAVAFRNLVELSPRRIELLSFDYQSSALPLSYGLLMSHS